MRGLCDRRFWFAAALASLLACDRGAKTENRVPGPVKHCLAMRARLAGTHVLPVPDERDHALPELPDDKLSLTRYRTSIGDMWAYVTPDPRDGRRHPAILWAHGGFDFALGREFVARHGERQNDQSARALIDAGLIVMYPSYRGWHDNPGQPELLLGEVDDYVAAAEHLRQLSYVDPDRIYLGGFSTGGTIVALAASLTDNYRAAFSFGPVARTYGNLRFDIAQPNALEVLLRSPISCIGGVGRPIWLAEGASAPGNATDVRHLGDVAAVAGVPVHTTLVAGGNHFTSIGPLVDSLAMQLVRDTGPTPAFSFDDVEPAL